MDAGASTVYRSDPGSISTNGKCRKQGRGAPAMANGYSICGIARTQHHRDPSEVNSFEEGDQHADYPHIVRSTDAMDESVPNSPFLAQNSLDSS